MTSRTPMQRLLLRNIPPLYRPLQAQQQRFFSQSSNHAARKQEGQLKQPKQKSMDVMRREMTSRDQRMNVDIGLLPGTFIMPTGPRLPSLTSNPSERWKLEYHRAWTRIKDFGVRHLFRLVYIRPRPDFQSRKLPTLARDLYEQMYTSFSTGNLAPMYPKLCDNLAQTLESRISARSPNTALSWTLHQYKGQPKVVSHKYIPMQDPSDTTSDKTKQTTMQQVVVRIRSVQSLKKVTRQRMKDGKVVEKLDEGSADKPKDVTEYFVIQRLMKRGRLGDWVVWGTTTESSLADIK